MRGTLHEFLAELSATMCKVPAFPSANMASSCWHARCINSGTPLRASLVALIGELYATAGSEPQQSAKPAKPESGQEPPAAARPESQQSAGGTAKPESGSEPATAATAGPESQSRQQSERSATERSAAQRSAA